MSRLAKVLGAVVAVATLAAGTAILFTANRADSAAPAPPAPPAPAAANLWKHYAVQSPSTGKIERFWVGHRAGLKADGRYPVIYFLPGLLDDEDRWKSALDPHLGKFDIIAVCTSVGGATWFMNSPAQPWMKWGDFLTEDLRAFVESHYPASQEKGQRGVVGISAGGHAAFYHAVTRTDLYGSVSVLSGAMELRGYAGGVGLDRWIGPRTGDAMALYSDRSCIVLAGRHDGPLPFALFLDAGDKDGALPQMEAMRKILDVKGHKYRWFVGQGVHNWSYWNTRAADHLAWHAEQFAANRSDNRYTEKAPAKAAELSVLAALPGITLSDEAVRRLRAPWQPAACRVVTLTGLPRDGGPLARSDPKYKEVKLAANSTATGHEPGLYVYRLTLSVTTPLPKEGTITLATKLQNGRSLYLFALPNAAFTLPAGPPQQKQELRSRLAIEFKRPDPLRGGIIAAIQMIDPAGNPIGDPVVGSAGPGTAAVEGWPVAPQVELEWVLSLVGEKALPLAAINDARLEAEP